MKEEYRLPSGEFTFSAKKYAEAWKALYEPLEEILGAVLVGFDPDMQFAPRNGVNGYGTPFKLPVSVAKNILKNCQKST